MLGYRVVRGPDWSWGDQDNGEGNVGTVVEIGRSGSKTPCRTLVVQWDCGTRTNYRIGYQGAYDLLVFDSGPAGVKHPSKKCDGCREHAFIRGTRWQCAQCKDYDLCTTCYMADHHDKNHRFRRYETETSNGHDVSPRSSTRAYIASRGLFQGARVMRGYHWEWGDQDGGPGKLGKIVEIRGYQEDSYRSVAQVTWDNVSSKNIYRIGHKGKVDLKYVEPGVGPGYYRDHLPTCGKATVMTEAVTTGTKTFKIGERVIVNLDIDVLKQMQKDHGGWHNKMAEIRGKVGEVHRYTNAGDVRVQYNPNDFQQRPKTRTNRDDYRWTFNPGALQRVLETEHTGQSSVEPTTSRSSHYGEAMATESLENSMHHSMEQNESFGSFSSTGCCAGDIASSDRTIPKLEGAQLDDSGIHSQLQANSKVYPAYVVARYCMKEQLVEVLNMGANMSATDKDGRTVLHSAVIGNKPENVKYLMSIITDSSVHDKEGNTALHTAVLYNHFECSKEILCAKNGRKRLINAKNDDGNTALHLCMCSQCDPRLLQLLVEAGADVNEPNATGFTCTDILVRGLSENQVSRIKLPNTSKPWKMTRSVLHKHNLIDEDGTAPRVISILCYLVLNGAKPGNILLKLPTQNWQHCLTTCISRSTQNGNTRFSQELSSMERESYITRPVCKLCDNPATVCFEPCKHEVLCKQCSKTARKCLECGEAITSKYSDGQILTMEPVEDPSCKICMDRKINRVFIPCGHAATCHECCESIKVCPICRQPIREKTAFFLS